LFNGESLSDLTTDSVACLQQGVVALQPQLAVVGFSIMRGIVSVLELEDGVDTDKIGIFFFFANKRKKKEKENERIKMSSIILRDEIK
jgi:hypothetical protein